MNNRLLVKYNSRLKFVVLVTHPGKGLHAVQFKFKRRISEFIFEFEVTNSQIEDSTELICIESKSSEISYFDLTNFAINTYIQKVKRPSLGISTIVDHTKTLFEQVK